MSDETQRRRRTYGNWRLPRTAGLLAGMGSAGNYILIGGLSLTMLSALFSKTLSVVLGVLLGLTILLLNVRDRHQMNFIQKRSERMAFWNQKNSGATTYRSGVISKIPGGKRQLPGLLAGSRLYEFTDAFGDPFGVLHYPSTNTFVVTFATQPQGGSTVDQEQFDEWVANWGAWMAERGNEQGFIGMNATLETAPDTGLRARDELEASIDPNASAFSTQVVREVVEQRSAGTPRIAGYVSVMWSAAPRRGVRRRTIDEMGAYLGTRVRGLAQKLSTTGAGVARVCTPAELCEVTMTAYQPTAASVFDRVRAGGGTPDLDWSDVGPTAHEAFWDSYRHEGSISRTWTMTAPPRSAVRETTMRAMVSPSGPIQRKRVTVLYRPQDPAESSRMAEKQTKEAQNRGRMLRRRTAVLSRDEIAAQATEEEVAGEAVMVPFGMLVTATAASPELVPEMEFAIESAAATAHLQLRIAYGTQDAAFAAALPLGIIPSRHANLMSKAGRL